jgi:PAS domain S-box-containing protein
MPSRDFGKQHRIKAIQYLLNEEILGARFLSSCEGRNLMKKKTRTRQHLPLEMEDFRTRLKVAEQRLEEANELMQAEITDRKRAEETLEQAKRHFESVVETIREPLLVLTADLNVISANQSFYEAFKVTPEETEGQFIYSIGNHQWDIPALRKLLEEIIPQNTHFNNFEVDHEFPGLGRRTMLLNARRIYRQGKGRDLILLAIEDITGRKQMEEALRSSETRYRRLFETAQDGILILDADTAQIIDVNPFLTEMLGYSHKDFMGRKLWEIGAFQDIEASKVAFLELQRKGYVRYEDLPLETRDERQVDVEFISNVYFVNHKRVIQCNIRDITLRKRIEDERRKLLHDLQDALTKIKRLRGLLPICASCKKIRDDKGYWNELEAYILEHSEAEITHGICPDCMKKLYGAVLEEDFDSKKQ